MKDEFGPHPINPKNPINPGSDNPFATLRRGCLFFFCENYRYTWCRLAHLRGFGTSAGTAVPYTLSDRERSIRMEQRLDDLEKRMDGLDARMDRLETRMDRLEGNITSQFETLYIVFFTGIVALVGFILWDRRTMVKPVVDDQRSL